MRVIVFEPDHTGHHLHYLRLLIPAIQTLRERVDLQLVLAHRACEQVEFATHLSDLGQLKIVEAPFPYTTGIRRAAESKVKGLTWAVREVQPDHVILPYGDGLVQMLGARRLTGRNPLPRGAEAEALMMRGTFAYAAQSRLRSRLRRFVWMTSVGAAPLCRVHMLDPLPFDMVRARGGHLARRVALMADPIEKPEPMTRAEGRSRLGIPTEGRYVGIVGVLNESKGIDRFLAAFRAARLSASDRMLLVGPVADTVRKLLEGPFEALIRAGRIRVIDGYASRARIEAAIAACDVVCTPYPAHIGSATFVIRAAAAGRPVLGSTFGWIGRTVQRFDMGWTCDVDDQTGFAHAIEFSLERSGSYAPTEATRRFLQFHSPENFAAQWTQRLRERLGLPAASGLTEWEWVTAASDDRSR